MARIKGAKKLPGVDAIMLPGEGGSGRCAAVMSAGVVSIEKNLYEGMKKVRRPSRPGLSPSAVSSEMRAVFREQAPTENSGSRREVGAAWCWVSRHCWRRGNCVSVRSKPAFSAL